MASVFTSIGNWVNERAPGLMPVYRKHMTEYYAPKNFNFWYYFGVLAFVVLASQIFTGIFMAMFYKPGAATAFDSVEYAMRDVDWGWLIRYMHSTGASMFFVVIYVHMFRGLMYGSYKKPRELVWLIGMLIFLALMAEAFMGYVLPWGNMSFWGAKVIISLFGAVPVIGDTLVQWIMGDYNPADATLNRFFALHVVALPLVLLVLVVFHVFALHEVGSNNPEGVDVKHGPKGNRWSPTAPADGVPFHPYYTVHDLVAIGGFLIVCSLIIFYQPTLGGWFLENDNFIPANPLVTPPDIKPVWYFTPFYGILRVIPSKGLGILAMFASIVLLFLLPWLDRGQVRSVRYRGLGYRIALTVFALTFLLLGSIGAGLAAQWIPKLFGAKADESSIEMHFGWLLVALYFGYFVFLWVYTAFGIEKTKPVPERVTGGH